jgi:hypothetical protein
MGLKDKVRLQNSKQSSIDTMLTNKEAAFVVTKLRQATYQGTEFEVFYQVMAKLQKLTESK